MKAFEKALINESWDFYTKYRNHSFIYGQIIKRLSIIFISNSLTSFLLLKKMIEDLLEIDISKSKREEDLIEIRLGNDEAVQIDLSKLYLHSKYLQTKYKYCECIDIIPHEIQAIEEKLNISSTSIKLFLEILEEEKVKFLYEHYKDIYTISEYFCTTTITSELDKISSEKLFHDLNFTIQVLLDSERINNSY